MSRTILNEQGKKPFLSARKKLSEIESAIVSSRTSQRSLVGEIINLMFRFNPTRSIVNQIWI